MAAVPTREAQDDKRPLRERLVGDATRLVNRMTGLLALHGIAKFDGRSKTASQRLRAVHEIATRSADDARQLSRGSGAAHCGVQGMRPPSRARCR
jgi:hypothetical protein